MIAFVIHLKLVNTLRKQERVTVNPQILQEADQV